MASCPRAPSCARPHEPGLIGLCSRMKAFDPKPSFGVPPRRRMGWPITIRGGAPRRHLCLRAEEKNGAAPRSFAPDAYDCIMDPVETTPEYKAVEAHAPPPMASSPQIVTPARQSVRRLSQPDSRPPIQRQPVDRLNRHPSDKGGPTSSFALDNKRPIQGGPKGRMRGCATAEVCGAVVTANHVPSRSPSPQPSPRKRGEGG